MTDAEMAEKFAKMRLDLARLLAEAALMATTPDDSGVGRLMSQAGVTRYFVSPLTQALAALDAHR